MNTRTIACAAVLGVSTCISFPVQGFAADLDTSTSPTLSTSDASYDSATISTSETVTVSAENIAIETITIDGGTLQMANWSNSTPVSLSTDSLTNTNGTLGVHTGTLTIKETLNNSGVTGINNWGDNDDTTTGTINAKNLENSGTFTIDNAALTVTEKVSNSGTFTISNASSTVQIATLENTAGEFKLNGGSLTVTNFYNNGGIFYLNGGTMDVTNFYLNAGEFQLNSGTLDVTNFYLNGGTFSLNGGTFDAENIYYSSDFSMGVGTTIQTTILESTASSATFGVNNANLTVTTLNNTGTFTINSFDDNSDTTTNDYSTVAITTLNNASGAMLVVNGDGNSSSNVHLTVSSDTINYGSIVLNNGANVAFEGSLTNASSLTVNNANTLLAVTGDFTNGSESTAATIKIDDGADVTVGTAGSSITFTNANGTVEVMNTGTSLTVNGDFINGTASTAGILHIHDDDAVVTITGDLTNENGLVGVHSGTLTIEGVLINNSSSTVSGDGYHQDNEEAIHVHDAKLIVSTLYLNAGGLGLYNGGTAELTSIYALSGSIINVYGGGIFQAESGTIEGAFTIGNGYEATENGVTTTVANGLLNKTGDGTLALSSLASYGDVTINAGTLTINSGYNTGATSVFTIESGASFTKTGTATDTLILSNSVINYGTITVSNGGLVINNLSTTGSDFTTNGDIIVTGQNSYLQLGYLGSIAIETLMNTGFLTCENGALTMLQASVTFDNGVGLILDDDADLLVSNGTVTGSTTTSDVVFDDDTVFKLNGHGFDRYNAAITISGTAGSVDIASDANFLATNLTATTYYTLIANVNSSQTAVESTGWYTGVEAGSLDRMLEDATIVYVASGDATYGATSTNDIVLVSGAVTDTNFGVDDEIFDNMQDLWEEKENNKDADNAGTGFVSDAADKTDIPDDAEAGKTLESALNVAVTGGVAGMTAEASDIASQAVNHRIDGIRAEAGEYYEDISATDWGIWAIPLYQQSQVRDMKIGVNSGGYDGYITGIIAGIDRKKDEWTFGFALGAGVGEAESTGSYVDTSTQLDFWSAILYAGYHKGAFELKGDFTFTKTHSDINQANPYHLVSSADINAEVNSQLYSLGATASYKIEGDEIDMTPHVGVRYRSYQQDSFTSTLGGRDLFTTHAGQMDTLLLPIGVTFSDEFLYNEWLITPRVDLSFTAVFGDTAIINSVGIAGTGADVDAFGTVSIEADVLDNGFASLSIGCGAKKDNWSLGLDFDFQKSQRRAAQAVFARVAYRF